MYILYVYTNVKLSYENLPILYQIPIVISTAFEPTTTRLNGWKKTTVSLDHAR